MKLNVPKYIIDLPAYVPGKPIEEVEREYGISDSIKLASNENPLGPSPKAIVAIQAALPRSHRYPDQAGYELVHKLADKLRLGPDCIVLGNGSDDVIAMLGLAFLQPGDQVVIPRPAFQMYEITVRSAGAQPVWVPLDDFTTDLNGMAAAANSGARMVFITNPHNPAGTIVTRSAFEAFLDAIPPDVIVVLDEAYIEFAKSADCPGQRRLSEHGAADRRVAHFFQGIRPGRFEGWIWSDASRTGCGAQSGAPAIQCQFTCDGSGSSGTGRCRLY